MIKVMSKSERSFEQTEFSVEPYIISSQGLSFKKPASLRILSKVSLLYHKAAILASVGAC